MKQSKDLNGNTSIPGGSHLPGGSPKDSSKSAVNQEPSSASPKDSPMVGPMKGNITGIKNFASDEAPKKSSLSHPKGKETGVTKRVG